MARRSALTMTASVAATVTLLLAAAPGLGDPQSSRTVSAAKDEAAVKIRVKDNFFEPRSTSVVQDHHVVWLWRGSNRHNVVFTKVPLEASRKGARTRTDGRWKRIFRVPGLYRYVCRIYAGMRGTITVEPPGPVAGGRS